MPSTFAATHHTGLMPTSIPSEAMNRTGHLDRQRLLLLAMLIAGLLAGLVGTHHMPVEPTSTITATQAAQHDEAPAPARHDDHGSGDHSGLVHLCVAILAAGALIVLTMLMWRIPVLVSPVPPTRAPQARSTPRAPPPTAPDRLALLCVLRT